jgi:hypothetical protein
MSEELLELHKKIAEKILNYGGLYWEDLTIHATKTHGRVIPEILAINIAGKLSGITILDSSRISVELMLEVSEFMGKKPKIFQFGNKDLEIPGAQNLKISVEKIRESASIFSKIIMAYGANREYEEEIRKEIMNLDDVEELSNLMMMLHTPPKIHEKIKMELKKMMREGGKINVITNVAGIVGGMIMNPIMVAPKGLALIQTIINMKDKEEDADCQLINNIIEMIKPEVIGRMVEDKDSGILEELEGEEFPIILCNITNEIYRPLKTFLTWSIIRSINNYGKTLVLSEADEIARINGLAEAIRKEAKSRGVKMVYVFQDDDSEAWFGDKNVIFDMKTSKLMKVMKDEEATCTSQLIQKLSKIKELERYGELGFVIRYMGGSWNIEKVNFRGGVINRVRGILIKVLDKFM